MDYFRALLALQAELIKLQDWVVYNKEKVVVIFEGRDSAGKGGVIKRITQRLNPRVARVVALPAPDDREQTQWYFQRYVPHLPAGGEIVLFDRSWYNRSGVERVMGFATEDQVEQFFHDVPEFERMLVRSGIRLVKYWFSITDEEQQLRFLMRIHDPLKQWKLSPMDLQSRVRWEAYTKAKEETFARTNIPEAPWYIVEGNDKKRARLNCIDHLLAQIPYEAGAARGDHPARAGVQPELRAQGAAARALRAAEVLTPLAPLEGHGGLSPPGRLASVAMAKPDAIPAVRAIPRWISRLSPARVLAVLALYLAIMALQAALLAPSGRSDDSETLLLSQSLAWGYELKNPPAFYWVAWAATHVFGASLPVIYALRLACVFAAFAGLYAIARRLQPDPLLAACAGLAMLATLHFHWYLLFYLTNTTFAMALAPLAVLALFRLRSHPTLASYAIFGAVLGLGILSRYNFAIFAAALVAAAFTAPDWRALLLRRRALLSLAIVVLMLLPHVVWVAQNWSTLAGHVRARSSAPRRRPTPDGCWTASAGSPRPRSAS